MTVGEGVEPRSALFAARTLKLWPAEAATRHVAALRERADCAATAHCRERSEVRERPTKDAAVAEWAEEKEVVQNVCIFKISSLNVMLIYNISMHLSNLRK